MEIFFKHSLNYEPIGPGQIVRPAPQTRIEIRQKAETHLRSKYAPGTYTDNKICNEILQHQYGFYEAELDRLIPLIATTRWVGELLFQYDESGKVSRKFKLNKLSKSDQALWHSIGAVYRQSLDLMCEKIAALGRIEKLSELWPTQIPDFERALVCAEKSVEYAEVSNYTYIVVPKATSITIHPVKADPYFEHQINEAVDKLIREHRVQNHREITERKKYLDNSFNPFDHQYHASILNEALLTAYGISYEQYQALVTLAPSRFKQPKSYKNIPMCIKADLIDGITEETQMSRNSVEFVINSLVLDTSAPREVWNSRQLNRINKQPFLQLISDSGEVLMWSNRKVGDFLTLLDSDLTFNKLPQAWTDPAVVSAVTEISRAAGKWFERSVIRQLELLGFQGCRIKDGTFDDHKEVKFDCGEIDFLGYHPATNCLAIFEFKMFETGFDARGIRQVRSAFLEGDKAYVTVFTKKIKWVSDNIDFVTTYLRSRCNVEIAAAPNILRTAFITFYPSQMNLFFQDPACKSLAQFVEEFKAKGEWPYSELQE